MKIGVYLQYLEVGKVPKGLPRESIKESEKMSKNNCISKFQFIFALVIKAFFVYCKVVKEKEYSSFLNR